MKVASMAECWGLPVAPHAFADLHAHLVAAIPNGLTVEYSPTMDAILEKPVTVQNGYIELPQTPGHGMQLSEEKSAALLVDRVEIVS